MLLILLFPAGCRAGETPPVIVVGSEIDFPPYALVDEHGEADGFSVDLLRAVAEVMGLEIEIRPGPWPEVLSAFKEGRLGLLPLVALSAERADMATFTKPHTVAFDSFFVRRGATPIRSLAEARGRTVVVMTNDAAHEALLASRIPVNIIETRTIPEAMRLLAAGRHDAVLVPKLLGILVLRQLGLEGVIEPGPPIPDYQRRFAFAVQRGNLELRDKLEQGLSIVHATGRYNKLYDKWFSKIDQRDAVPVLVILWIAGGVGGIVLLSVTWTLLLRRQVLQRTASLAAEVTARMAIEETLRRTIAELSTAKDRLHISEILLNQSQSISKSGGWEYDVDSKRITWTNEVYNIYEVGPEYDPNDISMDIEFYAPIDRKTIAEAFGRAVTVGEPYDLELQLIGARGTRKWVHTCGRTEVIDGRVVRVFGNITDISRRKEIEHELVFSNSSLDAAQKLVNFGYLYYDYTSGIHCVSDELSKIIANDIDVLNCGENPLIAAVHPEDRDFVKNVIADSIAKRTPYDITFRLALAGRVRHVVSRGEILNNYVGSPLRYLCTMYDITELTMAREEVSKLAMIVASADEAIIGRFLDGTIFSWNRGAEALYGYAAGEVVGTRGEVMTPPDMDDPFGDMLQRIRDGQTIRGHETKRVRKDGQVIDVSFTLSPFPNALGEIVGVSMISRDITERKRLERELHELNNDLEIRVKERTAELELMVNELEAFSYTISHDLRTPLRAVDGYSRILSEEYADRLDDDGRRLIGVIRDNTAHMGQLISDILEFSRVGRKTAQTKVLDLGPMFEQVFTDLLPSAAERRPCLEIGSMPMAWGDSSLLRQVVINLLSNAIKFSRGQPDAIITVGGYPSDGENVYFVKDNGVGFDMTFASKLFGVFERLHPSGQFEGTGIGLAIVKRIISRHGGRVWAEGKVNEGAVFYFSLPVKE
ncbi:MAG: transporter substrate-binding domain-containing protein [Alphaproteobacteria bacterium]